MSDKIREALAGMLAIVDESRGVDGYHLSGDIAEWDTFPEVEIARAAIAQQPALAAPEGFLLVMPEQVEQHATTAWECPPQSRVVLVSTLKRLHTKNTAAPAAPIQADHTALLAELYQILGAHNAGEKVIDQIQAAIAGEPMLHASLLPYEAPAPAAQEPAAFYWQDLDAFPMTARRHGPYFGWPSEDAIARCQRYTKPVPLYAAPPAAEQLDHSGDSADMVWCACGDGYPADTHDAGFIHGSGMCQNCDAAIPAKDIQADADDLVVWRITLPSGESCHFGTESIAKAWGRGSGKVERIELKARPALELVAAEQPDTVKVPRELLACAARSCANGWVDYPTAKELRALLGKESEDHE